VICLFVPYFDSIKRVEGKEGRREEGKNERRKGGKLLFKILKTKDKIEQVFGLYAKKVIQLLTPQTIKKTITKETNSR
jgi:hypothetical protein